MLPWQKYSNPPKVHFCGIGGTGMVAGARLAVEAGWEVRGSDNPLYPPASDMVESLGVPVSIGYSEKNLEWNPDLVVVGNAMSRGHVEVEELLRRGIPYVSMSEWVKEVVLRKRRPVAVCGTHGKTTTTTLAAYLMDRCELNPGYFIGGQPLDFEHSSRLGEEGAPFVIEGDEYDTAFFDKRAKFFHYLPEIAIVTSVEFDHGDIYSDIEEIEKAFRLMLRQIPPGGWLIACADNPRAAKLADYAHSRVTTYGFSKDAHWRGELTGYSGGYQGMVVYRGEKRFAELAVPLAGRHNMQNVLAAVAATALMGGKVSAIQTALMEFKGVRRRMEAFHETSDRLFIDDFAHHPTAIKETIRAARERWVDREITVLVEPRSNTMVRNIHQLELEESFAGADRVWVGPVYRAERYEKGVILDREKLVASLAEKGIESGFSDEIDEGIAFIEKSERTKQLVLLLSNGAFGGIYKRICGHFA